MTYQRVVLQIVFLGWCILLMTCNEGVESTSTEQETDSKSKAAQDTESKTVTSSSTSSIHRTNEILKPSQIRNKRSNSLLDKEQFNEDNVGLDSAFLYSDQIMQNLLKTQSPKPLSYARSNFFLNLLKPRTTRYHSWDEHSLMHFGKRSSNANDGGDKVVVKRSADFWSPNTVLHFGKKSQSDNDMKGENSSPTSVNSEVLDFGLDISPEIPEEQNGKDSQSSWLDGAGNNLEKTEDKDTPIEGTEKKSGDPWHNMMSFGKKSENPWDHSTLHFGKREEPWHNMMSFGKRFENDWDHSTLHFGKRQDPWHNIMSFGKRSENPWDHSTLHFGKKDEPWHNMMSFGKRFENPWDHNTLHFGKRDEPWHNMMSFGKRFENPWDHNTLHFGKRDEPWHNMMSFGKRFENPWDHNTLHFGKKDEPWHNMMSFGKRFENPWDHNTLHFGKRDEPWHNMMSFGKRFENPWDHNTLHFGKRDEPWHNMMSFGKKSDNPWDHSTLHFGKRDDPWHNMMSFGKKSEPWHSMMSFGKKSENSWDNDTKNDDKREDPWHNMMSFGKRSVDDFGDHFTLHFGKREEPWHNMMSFGKRFENPWDHNTLHFGKRDEPWHNMMSFGKRFENPWDHNTLHFGKRDEPWHNMMSFGKKSDHPWDEHSTLHFGKRNEPWHNIMSFGKRSEKTIEDDELEDFGPHKNPWTEYDAMVFYKRFDPWDHNTLHFGKRSNVSLDTKLPETKSEDITNSKHIQKRSIDTWDNHHTMHFGKKSDPWDGHNTMHFGKKSEIQDFETEMNTDKKSGWDMHNTLHFGKKSDMWDTHNTMHFGKKSDPWDYHNTMHFGKKSGPWDYHNTMHFGKREPWDYHNTMHFGKKRDPWDYHNTMHFGKREDSQLLTGTETGKLKHENKNSKEHNLPKSENGEMYDTKTSKVTSEVPVRKRSIEMDKDNLKLSVAKKSNMKNEKELKENRVDYREKLETPLQQTRQNAGKMEQSNVYYKNDKSMAEGLKYTQDMKNKEQKDSNSNGDPTGTLNDKPVAVHQNGIGKRSLKSLDDVNRKLYNFPSSRIEEQILKPSGILEIGKDQENDNVKLLNQKNTKFRINKRSVDINFKKNSDSEKSENTDPNIEQFDDYSKEEFPDTVLHFGKRSLDGAEGNIQAKESENLWSIDDKRFDDFWNNYNTMHFGKKSYPWENHSTMHFGKRDPWDYHNTMHFGKRDPWDYHNTMHFGKRDPWDYHNTMHFGKRDPWDYHNTMHFGKRDPWDYHNTMHFGKREPWDYHNTMHFGKKFDPWEGTYKMHFGKRSSDWEHGLMHFGKRSEIQDDDILLTDFLSSVFDQEKLKQLLDEKTAKQFINDMRLRIPSNNPNNQEFLESLENLENAVTSHLKDENMDVPTKLNVLKSYLRPILKKILSEQIRQGVEMKDILPGSEDYFEENTDEIPEVSEDENMEEEYGKYDDSNDLRSKAIINEETELPIEREETNDGKLGPPPEWVGYSEDYKGKRNYLGKPELKRYFVPFQGPKSIVYPHAWFASQIRRSAFPKSPEYTRSIQLKMAEKKEDPFNSYMHFGRR